MKKQKSGIEKLTDPSVAQILNHAEEGIENAILSVFVGQKHINYVNLYLFFYKRRIRKYKKLTQNLNRVYILRKEVWTD